MPDCTTYSTLPSGRLLPLPSITSWPCLQQEAVAAAAAGSSSSSSSSSSSGSRSSWVPTQLLVADQHAPQSCVPSILNNSDQGGQNAFMAQIPT
jgi:hypothetical protein